eukprot:6366063-Alexandrium_andersonii.AAC.1
MDVFRNAMGSVESCLRDGGIDKCNVHEVAIVGRSTRIPRCGPGSLASLLVGASAGAGLERVHCLTRVSGLFFGLRRAR